MEKQGKLTSFTVLQKDSMKTVKEKHIKEWNKLLKKKKMANEITLQFINKTNNLCFSLSIDKPIANLIQNIKGTNESY